MKKIIYISSLLFSVILISCAKEDSTDPNSPSTPSSDVRDAFVANWNVTENSTTSTTPNSYVVGITKQASSSTAIVINNFYGLNTYSVSATVSGNFFNIPYQSIKNNTNSTIGFAIGSGTLATNTKINITYTTSISGSRDSCVSVFTK